MDMFDKNNISDLPDNIKYLIKNYKTIKNSKSDRVFDLLIKADRPVDHAEIHAAYYRTHSEELNPNSLRSFLVKGRYKSKNYEIKKVDGGYVLVGIGHAYSYPSKPNQVIAPMAAIVDEEYPDDF